MGVRTWGRWAALLTLGTACVGEPPSPPGASGAGSSGTDTGGSTSAPSTVGSDSGTTSGSEMDSSGGATTTTDDGADTTDEGSSSGLVPPQQELLERVDFGECGAPLWCIGGSGNPYIPNPEQQQRMQECFSAALRPPFELIELHFEVAMIVPEIEDLRVEVYTRDGMAGPGALLAESFVDPGVLMEGLNTIVFDPPLAIPESEICVGVAAPEVPGALGIAVAEFSLVEDVSFFELVGGPGCQFEDWTDVMDIPSIPEGNWCIGATIQSM